MRIARSLPVAFLLVISFNQTAICQGVNEVSRKADSLFVCQDYDNAILEYQRAVFFCETDIRYRFYQNIAKCFLSIGNSKSARTAYSNAWEACPDDSIREDILIELINMDLRERKYYSAMKMLQSIPDSDTAVLNRCKSIYQGICCWGLGDFDRAFIFFQEAIPPNQDKKVKDLIILQNNSEKMLSNRFSILPFLSAVVPGSGQIISGHPSDGLMSLALCGSIGTVAVGSVLLTNYNAFFMYLGPWFTRYYLGGIERTKELASQKKHIRRDEILHQALNLVDFNDRYTDIFTVETADDSASDLQSNLGNGLLNKALRIYQAHISSQDIIDCVYHPSCSSYAVETLQTNGFPGIFDAIDRLMRCHLLGHTNYSYYQDTGTFFDPVEVLRTQNSDEKAGRGIFSRN